MKKSHIIAIIAIAVAVGVLISVSGDVDTYATFADAMETPGEKHKVTGTLSKDKPMEYDPAVDPNYFSFYMKDKDGKEQKVVLKAAKPQDFERSESIVLTGMMTEDEFVATDMLMKCPSKYTPEEVKVKAKS